MKMAILFIGLIGLAMGLMLVNNGYAQVPPPEEAIVEEDAFSLESVNGEVSGISKNAISIVYNRDYDTATEYEILIPVTQQTTLKHKQKMTDIKVGDLVSVEYKKKIKGGELEAAVVNFIQTGVQESTNEPEQMAEVPTQE